MNKERRKELERAYALISEAQDIVDYVYGGESEAYDNLPEGLQNSERGERMYECVDAIEDLQSDIEEVISKINDIIYDEF